MTAFLLVAGIVVFAMVVAGVWLMHYAEAEPAARAVGRAPDPEEEREAREPSALRSSSSPISPAWAGSSSVPPA